MKLQEAIDYIRANCVATWTPQEVSQNDNPDRVDAAIATILNAVVKGELIDRKLAHDLVGALNEACVDDSVRLWAKDRQEAILQIGKDGQHEV